MQNYSCKIRLNGSLHNEVRKDSVTAPEVALLQHIHGPDSVVEIQAAGTNSKATDAEERDRLSLLYGEKHVKAVFGVASIPLPKEVAGAAVREVKAPRKRKAEKTAEVEEAATEDTGEQSEGDFLE